MNGSERYQADGASVSFVAAVCVRSANGDCVSPDPITRAKDRRRGSSRLQHWGRIVVGSRMKQLSSVTIVSTSVGPIIPYVPQTNIHWIL